MQIEASGNDPVLELNLPVHLDVDIYAGVFADLAAEQAHHGAAPGAREVRAVLEGVDHLGQVAHVEAGTSCQPLGFLQHSGVAQDFLDGDHSVTGPTSLRVSWK